MTLIGQDVLLRAGRRDKSLRNWLMQWAAVVAQSQWSSIKEVRAAYSSADGVPLASGTTATVFNVKGNQYRLIAWIDYDSQVVEALEVITHGEYSKDFWKERY